jgi:hypothetical protein
MTPPKQSPCKAPIEKESYKLPEKNQNDCVKRVQGISRIYR